MKILVSACLAGENCKYNGGNNQHPLVAELMAEHEVITVCPEVSGGLPTPRTPAEIRDGVVMTRDGRSVDEEYRLGAAKCLEIAKREQPDLIILQSRSPSCGVKQRYDGTFTGKLIDKPGVTAELLIENGFHTVDIEDFEKQNGRNARRGFVPEDDRNFSEESLEILRKAAAHVFYLINEGYDKKQAATFAGNHFLLSERQRLAITRSLATKEQLAERLSKQIGFDRLAGKTVWIDGFNTIITLEVMLNRSILLQCMDGTIRDLASLRGTYRLIPETKEAVRRMLRLLQDAQVREVKILLDQPVSNSGRLKTLIAEIGEEFSPDLDIRITKEVDRELYGKEYVITSDSVILDRCASWFNLTAEILKEEQGSAIKVWKE